MSRAQLKAYAPQARRDFIEMVTREAAVYGLTKSKMEPVEVTGDTAVIRGTAYPKRVARQRRQLDELVQRQGFEQTMESMAYTWFNRFMAIRYMELHGYLDHGYRVLSHPSGDATPEILQHAERVDLPGLDKQAIIDLKLDGTKDTELYRKLIIAQCNALHGAMPFLFERIDDATELLLPADLLHSESVTRKMVDSIDEEDWQEVEIVGWLYQFYISEKKELVDAKVKQGGIVEVDEIPAKTALFTPNWIVKYMLHNSLGAKWLATYPNSPLKAQMEYYIEPAEQDEDVQRQLKEITPESLNPEEITLLDPACGSGHILVEAYELFKAIYHERGYRAKDIPRLVLEKNLYGLEIDERAAQLSSFALLMKARADDRGLFSIPVALNICCIQESNGLDMDDPGLKSLFHDAKTYGALMPLNIELCLDQINAETSNTAKNQGYQLFLHDDDQAESMLLWQAKIFLQKYDVVVANPPYLGSGGMNGALRSFASRHYPDSKLDLFAMFLEKGFQFAKQDIGYNALVTMQGWMFLSSYEDMRKAMLNHKTFLTMAHLGPRAFSSITGEVVQTTAFSVVNTHSAGYRPTFFRLVDGEEVAKRQALAAGRNRFDAIRQDDFEKIEGTPLAYWVSSKIIELFQEKSSLGDIADCYSGLITKNTEKYIRFWHELDMGDISFNCASYDQSIKKAPPWIPCIHGIGGITWYGISRNVVKFEHGGKHFQKTGCGSLRNKQHYFKRCIAWADVGSGKNSFSEFPVGYIPNSTSHFCIPHTERHFDILLGLLNSEFGNDIFSLINPTIHLNPGEVKKLPLPKKLLLEDWGHVKQLREIEEAIAQTNEIYAVFKGCALVDTKENSLKDAARLSQQKGNCVREKYFSLIERNENLVALTLEIEKSAAPEQCPRRFEGNGQVEGLISYAIGCMMGRYSLDEPGLIYAHSGNQGFDASRYTTFPADEDGILPIMDLDWFDDDIANRAVEFIATAWQKEHLEENLNFLADSLDRKSSESSRECIRRYLSRDFYKDHLQTYKRRPIYWLFSSGKLRAFQCLVYLHRYNESTLARMRTEYVIPLQSKMNARLDHLKDDIANATSTAQAKKLEKEQDLIRKQQVELLTFDEKLRHFADQRISLDLDDGVKVNYGKFGDLLAEVKAVTGGKAE